MDEYERRKEAIRRVAQGEAISKVCTEVGRSRVWYYKWRPRYREYGLDGLQDRRPGHQPLQRTSDNLRELIIEIRDRLVSEAEAGAHHLGIGAGQIAQELRSLGITPPRQRTIYRILCAAGRTQRADSPHGYCPLPSAEMSNAVHQLDLWPRILEGGESLFLIHLVDVATWYPCGQVSDNKRTDTLLAFLLQSWQALGVPAVLQVDNEMSFNGGRWAARLGRLVRLALLLGCEVWFNPFRRTRAQRLRGTLPRAV
jgi:transposase